MPNQKSQENKKEKLFSTQHSGCKNLTLHSGWQGYTPRIHNNNNKRQVISRAQAAKVTPTGPTAADESPPSAVPADTGDPE